MTADLLPTSMQGALAIASGGQSPSGALCTRDLHKRFGGVSVLKGVELDVKEGQICAVLGQNGAGKTTLLNILTALVRPERGSVRIFGREVVGRHPWELSELGVARTFQSPRLMLEDSCLDNVGLAAVSTRGSSRCSGVRAREAARMALDQTGLAGVEGVVAGELPYGARRVLEIARCLVMRPRLLLLDEPAAGLSEGEEHGLAELLIRLRDDGMTILLIEHRMHLVGSVATRVVMLDSGRMIFDGTASEALGSPVVRERYLGAGEVGRDVQQPDR
ncbi:MAG: ABC transporter ATP-binding protein [Acidimicrobiales bacterium]